MIIAGKRLLCRTCGKNIWIGITGIEAVGFGGDLGNEDERINGRLAIPHSPFPNP